MPRFHFHHENGRRYPDEHGAELEDLAAARHAALRSFSEFVGEHPAEFWSAGSWRMTVTDGEGLALFSLELVATDAPVTRRVPPAGPQG